VLAGEDFAKLAREFGGHRLGAGGDLGWTNPGQMVPNSNRP
jgi:parvulin-like peptidyl-prolyl isomerase